MKELSIIFKKKAPRNHQWTNEEDHQLIKYAVASARRADSANGLNPDWEDILANAQGLIKRRTKNAMVSRWWKLKERYNVDRIIFETLAKYEQNDIIHGQSPALKLHSDEDIVDDDTFTNGSGSSSSSNSEVNANSFGNDEIIDGVMNDMKHKRKKQKIKRNSESLFAFLLFCV